MSCPDENPTQETNRVKRHVDFVLTPQGERVHCIDSKQKMKAVFPENSDQQSLTHEKWTIII